MNARQLLVFGVAIAACAVALIGILHATDVSDGIAVAAVSVLAVAIGSAVGAVVSVDERDLDEAASSPRQPKERPYAGGHHHARCRASTTWTFLVGCVVLLAGALVFNALEIEGLAWFGLVLVAMLIGSRVDHDRFYGPRTPQTHS